MKKFSVIFITAILSIACQRHSDSSNSFGWEMTGYASDSILIAMDNLIMSYGDPDLLNQLVEGYDSLVKKEDPKGHYLHRRLYWKGTAQFMNGEFEKGDSLRKEALFTCDSTRFPRDYAMYRMAVEQVTDFPDNISRYNRYSTDLQTFLKYGDLVSGFSRAVQLSNLMSETGMHRQAMEYALLADTLLLKADLPLLRTNNKVNIASCMFEGGDTINAIKTLKDLRTMPEIKGNPTMEAIVNFNIHQMSGDTVALKSAWNIVKQDDLLLKMRPLVLAALIKENMITPTPPSILWADSVLNTAHEYAYSTEEEMYLAAAKCEIASYGNDFSKLRASLKEYEGKVDQYKKELKRNELISSETQNQISKAEYEIEAQHLKNERTLWIIITIVSLLLAGAIVLLLKYVNRLKQTKLLRQLENERQNRLRIASELTLLEKEKLLADLQQKFDSLVKHNHLQDMVASEVMDILNQEETVSLRTVPPTRETEFMRIFMERFPKVSKTGRRIALWIWRGAETSEIARNMNIRKESVIQGRWRMRNQMELQPDEDLDIVIRTLL